MKPLEESKKHGIILPVNINTNDKFLNFLHPDFFVKNNDCKNDCLNFLRKIDVFASQSVSIIAIDYYILLILIFSIKT
jgi:hypothetical protein